MIFNKIKLLYLNIIHDKFVSTNVTIFYTIYFYKY